MFCTKVKEFLHRHGVAFAERNVAEDDAAFAELQRLRLMTTPVTIVDDHPPVVGFDDSVGNCILCGFPSPWWARSSRPQGRQRPWRERATVRAPVS